MNNQANNWVWKYEKNVTIICKNFLRPDSAAAEDVAHDVLLRISQRDGLDQVGDRSSWIRTAAYHECMDYFRESKRHPVWKGEPFKDLGVRMDEKLSDAKLDKEARGTAKDIENETDGPDSKDESEKIDPVKVWHSFERHDPDRATALYRSLHFVDQAFDGIKGDRRGFIREEQIKKTLVALKDAKRRTEKIFGTFTDQVFQEYADSIGTERVWYFDVGVIFQYRIRELIRWIESDSYLPEPTMSDDDFKGISIQGPVPPDEVLIHSHSGFKLFGFLDYMEDGDSEGFFWYSRRRRDFFHVDPDPLYVLYRVWNRILRKGRERKYGNRKLIRVLLFAFKKITAVRKDIDIFNSLTEETNFETLRTMSYGLNKGYSELADFIFRKSVRPPKRKTRFVYAEPEKKPAPPSSQPSRP